MMILTHHHLIYLTIKERHMEIFIAFIVGVVLTSYITNKGKFIIEIRHKDITEKPAPVVLTDEQLEKMLKNTEDLDPEVRKFYEQDSASVLDAVTATVNVHEEDELYD